LIAAIDLQREIVNLSDVVVLPWTTLKVTHNPLVAGSSPARPTLKTKTYLLIVELQERVLCNSCVIVPEAGKANKGAPSIDAELGSISGPAR
jgi:hypothetical protein